MGPELKKELLETLIQKLKGELSELEAAAESHHAFATDNEFKAESKYDTRALEASYLAGAEARRVEELKQDIQMLEEVDLGASTKYGEISIGALVELKHGDQTRLYFLIPTGGGSLLQVRGTPVLVVSIFSPLGDALLGLGQGDEFEVETPKDTRLYQVISFN